MFMLALRGERSSMRLATIFFFFSARTRFDSSRTVETHVARVMDDHSSAVDVGYVSHIHVNHGPVVEKPTASPFASKEAHTAVTEAVVDTTIKPNMVSPISRMPDVEASTPSPVTRSPQHPHRRNDPRARHPVVSTIITPRPVTGSPQVAGSRTNGLRVDREVLEGRSEPRCPRQSVRPKASIAITPKPK